MMLRRLLPPVFAWVLLANASPAIAESDIGPQEADKRFNEGKELFKQRRFAEARVKFLQACAAHRTRNCPKNLGVAEYELGLFADAATHLEEYVADDGARSDPQLPRIRKMLEESLAKSGHVSVEAPAGATIAVDEQPIGKAPLAGPIHLAPGTHSIRAALLSGNMLAVTISAEAGKSTKAVLKEPEPAPSPPTSASTAPLPPPPASAATSATPTPPTPVDQATEPSFWTTRRYVGIAVAGVGVLSLVTGGYFGVKSHDDADRAASAGANLGPSACTNPANPGCADVKSAHDAQSRDNTLSTVFVGVGAVAIVTGAVLILWPQSKATTTTAIVPVVSAHGGALQLRGEF